MKRLYAIATIYLLLTICLFAQADSLKKYFNNLGIRYNAKSMAGAVIKDGKVIFCEGYGKRNYAQNLPVIGDSTKFRIASISKMVVATALMKLFEEGKVKLDEDASTYLGFSLRNPKFPNNKITVRMIASHTAGILDADGAYDSFINDTYASTGSNIPALSQLLLQTGKYYKAATFSSNAPGTYFNYANIDYVIIGTIIEKVSGIRFDKYCKDNLFTPLGIDADFNIAEIQSFKQIAILYRNSGEIAADNFNGIKPQQKDLNGYQIGTNGAIYSPQGGLRISVKDLAIFSTLYINRGTVNNIKILNSATVDTMLKSVFTYNGQNGNTYYDCMKNYGIGNFKTNDLLQGVTLQGHFGEAYGLVSDMFFSIEKKLSIVVFISGSTLPYGLYSGWYKPEEEFYTAAYKYLNSTTDIKDYKSIHTNFNLFQNYPNPFNPTTVIKYKVQDANHISLKVFDALGREIATLVNEFKMAGEYNCNLRIENGELSSGVFFYQLKAGNYVQTKRMVLLK